MKCYDKMYHNVSLYIITLNDKYIIYKENYMLHQMQLGYLENELVDIVGRDHVLSDEADKLVYGLDYFWIPRMYVDRGRKPPLPDFIVLPSTTEEVSRIVKVANIYRIPVIPWGGGSGSQGGVTPIYGGITIDLKLMNKILEINHEAQSVTVQAGKNGYELEHELNNKGYTLGHIPASIHSATVGGYLAARGSGVLSTKYGKMEDIVMNVEVVLPNGDPIRTLPVPTHASGPGILQVFVGAEGSYGIITEATARIERLPEDRRFKAYLFKDLQSGLNACKEIILSRIQPSVMRLYDEPESQKRIEKILGMKIESGCYMCFAVEGDKEITAILEKRAIDICVRYEGEELGNKAAWEWWHHRYNFYFPPKALDLPWMFGTMDTLCTFDKIEKLYWTKKKLLEEKYAKWDLQYIAHLSHWFPWGAMVYDRFIIENPPWDADEALALHNEIWNDAARASIACGAVLNEHHGIGLKLGRLVREQYGPAFQVLEAIKNGLDPNTILNPGKMGFGPTR